MEKIIVNEETIAKVLKKIEDNEKLTVDDKVILQNTDTPVKLNTSNMPKIYMRSRATGYTTDFGNWNETNQWVIQDRASINSLINDFAPALNALFKRGQGLLVGGCFLYKLYPHPEQRSD